MKRSRLKSRSKKRSNQLAEYNRLRKAFLVDHCRCEVCRKQPSTQVHHVATRIGERLNDVAHWLATCYECHEKIHRHGQWARGEGFLS